MRMGVREDGDVPRRIDDLRGQDAYELLGLDPAAPRSALAPAYRRAMADAHPDRGGAADRAQLVNCAYELLSEHREAYDAHRRSLLPPAEAAEEDDFFADLFAGRRPASRPAPGIVLVDPVPEPLPDAPPPGRRVPRGLLLGVGVLVVVLAGAVLLTRQGGEDPSAGGVIVSSVPASGGADGPWTRTSMTPALSATTAADLVATPSASAPPSTGPAAGSTTGPPSPMTISAVSAGREHSCTIRSDASLWCRGAGEHGQLGTGTTADAADWVRVGDAGVRWSAVALDPTTTCGVTVDSALWCWGDNSLGQLGDGTTSSRTRPVQVQPGTAWRAVAVAGHVCGIRVDGSLWCWGAGGRGELGGTPVVGLATPQRVGADTGWTALDLTPGRTCAVRAGGERRCWGAA